MGGIKVPFFFFFSCKGTVLRLEAEFLVLKKMVPRLVMLNVLALLGSWVFSVMGSVSYDRNAIIVNGQRRILVSGSIHYPRSTPEVYYCEMHFNIGFWILKFCSFRRNEFFCMGVFLILCFWCCTDVAGSYSEGKRRRGRCDSDICFLEWAWAWTRQSEWKFRPLWIIFINLLMFIILWVKVETRVYGEQSLWLPM